MNEDPINDGEDKRFGVVIVAWVNAVTMRSKRDRRIWLGIKLFAYLFD